MRAATGPAQPEAPLRIEMVLPALPRAGMEVVAASLGRGLADRGHYVGFTCLEGPGDLGEDLRAEGFRVSVVNAPGVRPNFFPTELAAWFREVRPDVVHAYNGVWLKAAAGAQSAGVPRVVFALHGLDIRDPWYVRPYTRLAARHTDRLVAVSNDLRAYLIDQLGPCPVDVIRNGVSTRRFGGARTPGLRRRLGIASDRRIVGTVARLDPVKNHVLMLEAFAAARERHRDLFLLLVGDGPCRRDLESRITAMGLRHHVLITGVIVDPAPLLNELELFLLSSHTEGTSMSVLEAMASGLPVIATAVGGTPALLRGGSCGALVPPGDARALAGAIDRLLDHPDDARALGQAAKREAEAEYSIASMVERYERVYGLAAPIPSSAPAPVPSIATCVE